MIFFSIVEQIIHMWEKEELIHRFFSKDFAMTFSEQKILLGDDKCILIIYYAVTDFLCYRLT